MIFFPVVTLLYFVLPEENPLGLAGEQLLLLYELARGIRAADGLSTLVTYIYALAVSPHCKAEGAQSGAHQQHRLQPRHARLFQIYTGMFIDVLNRVCGALGFAAARLPQVDILLPVDISFFASRRLAT